MTIKEAIEKLSHAEGQKELMAAYQEYVEAQDALTAYLDELDRLQTKLDRTKSDERKVSLEREIRGHSLDRPALFEARATTRKNLTLAVAKWMPTFSPARTQNQLRILEKENEYRQVKQELECLCALEDAADTLSLFLGEDAPNVHYMPFVGKGIVTSFEYLTNAEIETWFVEKIRDTEERVNNVLTDILGEKC